MIKEYKAWFDAFQRGKEVKNAVAAKNFQWMGSSLAGLIGAVLVIAQASGYYIPVSEEDIAKVGIGIAAIWEFVSAVLTVVTTSKIGIENQD